MLHYFLVPTSLYLAAHEHSRPYYTGGKIQIICAIVTALISNAAQYRCHLILYQLKCKKQQQDNDVSKMPYSIPKGFLFDYVCCPHYFVEIVFYLALWQVTLFQNTNYRNRHSEINIFDTDRLSRSLSLACSSFVGQPATFLWSHTR